MAGIKSRAGRIAAQARSSNPSQRWPEAEDVGFPGIRDIRRGMKSQVRGYRQELLSQGIRGKDLRQQVQAKRREVRDAAGQQILERVPEALRPYIKNPFKFAGRVGRSPFLGRIASMGMVEGAMPEKYGTDVSNALGDYYKERLPTEPGEVPEMEFYHNERPTFDRLQEYLQSRFDPSGNLQGLSPEEEARFRANARMALESGYQQSMQDAGQRLAASGIAPGSGIAAGQAGQLQMERARGLSGVELGLMEQNLARKRDYENLMGNMSALEEQGRQSDVGTTYGYLGDLARGALGMANLGDERRQFDLGMAMGAHQARLAREDMRRAARMARPGALEKVGSIFGGLATGFGG